MKPYLRTILFLLLLASVGCFAGEGESNVKMAKVDIAQLATGRPTTAYLWYPEGHCEKLPTGQGCLADSAIINKVVVFSHGSMGSAGEYRWLAEQLAAAGYVVLGMNYYGESWIYGKDTQNLRNVGLIWQRAQDLSATVTYLQKAAPFQKPVDWANLIAIGHSAGGQTSAMLAGATFDLQRLLRYCQTDAAKIDRSCQYAGHNAVPESFLKKFSASQKDARIKMLVMLDPALGSAVIPESLQTIHVPSLVVGAVNNDFLPWAVHGSIYAKGIPGSQQLLLTGAEGHFVFLDNCTDSSEVMGVALCKDAAGVNRTQVHQQITASLIQFIQAHPEAFGGNAEGPDIKSESATLAQLRDIISYTPRWVFLLLAVLIALGLLQTRTRSLNVRTAFIIPVSMLVLSFTGVVGSLGWQWQVIGSWLLGIIVIATLRTGLIDPAFARFDKATSKLTVQGSFWPLAVILAIFFARYALGVVAGMDLPLRHQPGFGVAMGLLLGALNGYFMSHLPVFWRARQSAIRAPVATDTL